MAFAIPLFAEPRDIVWAAVLESRELLDLLRGVWWFFALFVVSGIFNTILGEEFLFPGVLLPKMERVFGRWELGSKRGALWLLSPSPALGNPRVYH